MPQSRPPMKNYNYYWERLPPPPPAAAAAAAPPRHRKSEPSFSSSLLDAITRSIDDSDSAGGEPHRRRNASGGAQDPTTRRNYNESSSSSCSSSFFSSSDTDTPIRIRPRPIRTSPVLLARSDRVRSNAPLEKPNQTQKQLTSIKKKLRELRRSAGPGSPGARLAGFLNSLFHPAGAAKPKPKKQQSPPPSTTNSSSSSSCSRSCLSKTTPSTRGSGGGGGKRSVRFCPVGVIVGEDCRPCGEKDVFAGDFPAPARKAALVEVMMSATAAMEEDYESDSSEDLFELENLGGIGGGGAADYSKIDGSASFRDELPVYETTSLGINRAIARGLIV